MNRIFLFHTDTRDGKAHAKIKRWIWNYHTLSVESLVHSFYWLWCSQRMLAISQLMCFIIMYVCDNVDMQNSMPLNFKPVSLYSRSCNRLNLFRVSALISCNSLWRHLPPKHRQQESKSITASAVLKFKRSYEFKNNFTLKNWFKRRSASRQNFCLFVFSHKSSSQPKWYSFPRLYKPCALISVAHKIRRTMFTVKNPNLLPILRLVFVSNTMR